MGSSIRVLDFDLILLRYQLIEDMTVDPQNRFDLVSLCFWGSYHPGWYCLGLVHRLITAVRGFGLADCGSSHALADLHPNRVVEWVLSGVCRWNEQDSPAVPWACTLT